jgi:hypothetical protein
MESNAGGTKSPFKSGLNLADGYNERRYASIPAVWGEAIEVPERVVLAFGEPM